MAPLTPAPDARRRGRLQLLGIVALFVLPLALAWLLYGNWRPTGSVHHGELLDPARPLSALAARGTDDTGTGAGLPEDYLRGRWTLAYLAAGECRQACRDGLYKIRQIRLALGGKNIDRIQTLGLLASPPGAELRDWLAREHAAMTVAVADSEDAAALRRPFAGDKTDNTDDGVFVIDPLGNLLLRYRREAPPKDIIADLKRLLKLSRIG